MERTLNVERREDTGKGVARKIRAAGHVPGVVYGRGGDPVKISVDARELFHTLHTDAGMNVLVELKMDDSRVLAMPREVQRDHIRGVFKHVDFIRIARDEKITVEVPIVLVGESAGVKEGGVIEHHLWTLQIEAFPQDVPTSVEVDISGVALHEAFKVSELRLPDTVTILSEPDETIVSVVPPQVRKVDEGEVEGLEAEAAEGGEDEAAGAGSESGSSGGSQE